MPIRFGRGYAAFFSSFVESQATASVVTTPATMGKSKLCSAAEMIV